MISRVRLTWICIWLLTSDSAGVHASIIGGAEVHVEQGSTLNLTCVVKNSLEKPHYLLWYHNNKVMIITLKKGLWILSFLQSKWDYWKNLSILSAQDFVKIVLNEKPPAEE